MAPLETRARFAFVVVLIAALGCGEEEQPPHAATATAVSALTAADKTNAARASVYAAKAARYREAAAAQRQQAAAYTRSAPKVEQAVVTNWNEQMKVTHETRAAAAEQIAARIQAVADFHAAEASKEVSR